MTVLLAGGGLFVCSFILQAVLWRIWMPRRQMPALFLLYVITPPAALTLGALTGHLPALSAAESVRAAILYLSLMLAYVTLYSAIEMQSPTLAIISFVAKAGSAGCSDDELAARFGIDTELAQRLTLMDQAGWIRCAGDTLRLTGKGRFYAQMFENVARIFGITRGVSAAG
jgi:hypothetical protein